MKKYINVFLLVSFIILLSSCFNSQDEINKAKQNLGIIKSDNIIVENIDQNNNGVEEVVNKKEIDNNEENNNGIEEKVDNQNNEVGNKEYTKNIEIKSLTKNQLLEIDDLSNIDLLGGAIEITGKTLGNVDKIVVDFSNESSDFPNDTYRLKQFKAGDNTFLYRAFSKYETLDFGKNIYIFTAYSGDEVTKLQLIINVKDEVEEKQDIVNNLDISKFPKNGEFGTPTNLGNGKIGYSDLNGLEIVEKNITDFTCENVTSKLAEFIDGYFYWNTCRPISGEEGVSFFVIRLDGDKYIYEKHYYLPYKGIYGIQELETGTGVDKTNIGEKNTELKLENDKFDILKITDKLFKELK